MYHFSLYTRILEGLQQKLRGLEPLSPIASAATDAYYVKCLDIYATLCSILSLTLCAIFDGNLLTNFNVIVFCGHGVFTFVWSGIYKSTDQIVILHFTLKLRVVDP